MKVVCFLGTIALVVIGTSALSAAPDRMTNSVGIVLAPIPAGTFTMGQGGAQTDYVMTQHPTETDRAQWDERPVHRVTISNGFAIGITEVTNAQFRHFRPGHRPEEPADWAAVDVSWYDAVEFCAWLSEREKRSYRLPTEAEWEYACRAGTTEAFNTGASLPTGYQKWFGDLGLRKQYFPDGAMPPDVKWSADEPSRRVAERAANPWGLFDMHGNVSEWCLDWYGPYQEAAAIDPVGRAAGDFKVIRGGGYSMLSTFLRSANRAGWIPSARNDLTGFRIVAAAAPTTAPLAAVAAARNAQNVSQRTVSPRREQNSAPHFNGPQQYVKITPGSAGPLFETHNHSVGLTECPNGDLLAVWFSCVQEPGSEVSNAASRLRYGQAEWDEASVFWDAPDVNDHAPKLWWDGADTLYHFARGLTEDIVRTSTDNGVTWSRATTFGPYGELGSHPSRLRNGTYAVVHDAATARLTVSSDAGRTWSTLAVSGPSDFRDGGCGYRPAGIHTPLVELQDGRLLTIGRLDRADEQARFGRKAPFSYSSDQGKTWSYVASPFPAMSQRQRPLLIRLQEGPLLLVSFTDQWREWKDRRGMDFPAANGASYRGYGMFAALSEDDGKTWPIRRLLTPGGPPRVVQTINKVECTLSATLAEPTGYLAIVQARDGNLHLLTSKNHYSFNVAWLRQLPPAPAL